MDESLLRIGEVAAFFNVSVKAIRLYEKKGIIAPIKIDPSTGYRYYTADQIHQLNALVELKALGFSLAEVKGILNGKITDEQFSAALTRKRMAWQDAIATAESKIEAIDSIANRLSKSRPTVKLQELTEEQRAWLLVKMVCVEELSGQVALSEAIWL